MAYSKQTWVTGDVITADKLNHIEDGLEAVSDYDLVLLTTTIRLDAITADNTSIESGNFNDCMAKFHRGEEVKIRVHGLYVENEDEWYACEYKIIRQYADMGYNDAIILSVVGGYTMPTDHFYVQKISNGTYYDATLSGIPYTIIRITESGISCDYRFFARYS